MTYEDRILILSAKMIAHTKQLIMQKKESKENYLKWLAETRAELELVYAEMALEDKTFDDLFTDIQAN